MGSIPTRSTIFPTSKIFAKIIARILGVGVSYCCGQDQAPSALGYFILKSNCLNAPVRGLKADGLQRQDDAGNVDRMAAWEDMQKAARKDGLPDATIGV